MMATVLSPMRCKLFKFPYIVASTHTNTIGDRFGGELKNWDVRGKLGSVRVPTLIINGKEDMAQDFVVEPLYREIKEAGRAEVKWVTMPNSSHCPMWEERQDYMKLVDDFISEKSA